MIDYHVHSSLSGDSAASIAAVCGAAASAGLREICFTEHIDFEPTDPSYGAFDYDRFALEVARAREQFDGALEIRLGVEVDFQERYRSQIEAFLAANDFDYVLGSAHYVDGIMLEKHAAYFGSRTRDEAYEPYFVSVLAAVETGWFDALAHIDVCKRYGVRYFGQFDWLAYKARIDDVLRAVIRRDMTLEVNSSGVRQSPGEPYPAGGILHRFRELGGRHVTVGSDAHKSEDVGAGICEALEIIAQTGFDSVDTFRSRERRPIRLTNAESAHTNPGGSH